MPYDTTTYEFGAELERLRERYDDLQARADDGEAADADRAAAEQLAAHVRRTANGVNYLAEEHGENAAVTVGALAMRDSALVRDRLEAHREEAEKAGIAGGTDGSRDLYQVAAGLVDAPFIDDDIDATAAAHFDDVVAVVGEQPPQVVEWLLDRVQEATALPDAVGNASGDQ